MTDYIGALAADQILRPNESLVSPNGRYRLIYQSDGNLVVYLGEVPLWATDTEGKPVGHAVMQGDGNFVVYGHDGKAVIFNTGTAGTPGARIEMQDDANVVVYGPPPTNTILWARKIRPLLQLQAIRDRGLFVEIRGYGFTPQSLVSLDYRLDARQDDGPITHSNGSVELMSDEGGSLTLRVPISPVGLTGAAVAGVDRSTGVEAAAEM